MSAGILTGTLGGTIRGWSHFSTGPVRAGGCGDVNACEGRGQGDAVRRAARRDGHVISTWTLAADAIRRRAHRIIALSALAATLLLAAPARADGPTFSIGRQLGVIDAYGVGHLTDLSTRVGFRSGRLVFFGLLDYANVSVETEEEYYDYVTDEVETETRETDFSALTLGAGARFFLAHPEAGHAAPYVVGALFTVIPTAEDDDGDDAAEDVSSLGAQAGFGAEYFVADSFSVGGELGLILFAADNDDKQKASLTHLYSALQLSFYL